MKDLVYRNASDALPYLAADIMARGWYFDSRAGKTREVTGAHIVLLRPWERAIITPGRHASLPAQIAETMWVLSGRDDVAWLRNYLPRAGEFSDDGKTWRGGYGPRIRNWQRIDQLRHVVELLRSDPNTRRAVIAIYDPAVDTRPGKDIPCNNWLHFLIRDGKLQMFVTTRSNDLIWGWSGINAFEWSALQEIVAGLVGVGIGKLHFNISSLHIYERHFQKADAMARAGSNHNYSSTAPVQDPRFNIEAGEVEDFDDLVELWFGIEGLCRRREFGAADEGIDTFPEPMLQSWLRVIRWYWSRKGTAYPQLNPEGSMCPLQVALIESPKRTWPPILENEFFSSDYEVQDPQQQDFWEYAAALHQEKHLAYGDSWKRRGESLGILANIARKVDRIGGSETADETSADTALDLLIYLIKYRLWLTDHAGAEWPMFVSTDFGDHMSDLHAPVAEYLAALRYKDAGGVTLDSVGIKNTEKFLKQDFDILQECVEVAGFESTVASKIAVLNSMIARAHRLAYTLWYREQNAKRSWKGYEVQDPQGVGN